MPGEGCGLWCSDAVKEWELKVQSANQGRPKCHISTPTASKRVCHWVQRPQAVHESRIVPVVFAVGVGEGGGAQNTPNKLWYDSEPIDGEGSVGKWHVSTT